ncbi:MAG: M23 family metallopeptidase [Pseudomonadota bacterium]
MSAQSTQPSNITASPLFQKSSKSTIEVELGNEPALISGNGRRAPDRRRVSARWMSGSVLTGLTSVLLMGGALYAALDGRQQLARPASMIDRFVADNAVNAASSATLGDSPVTIVALEPASEKIMQVPTVTRVGNSNVIRKRPFAYASAPLAIIPLRKVDYPKFNPLNVFRSSDADAVVATSDVIYGADIESEVRVQTVPFPLETAVYEQSTRISANEAAAIVKQARASLLEGQVEQVAALPYLDTSRFTLKQDDVIPASGLDIRIINENVSTAVQSSSDDLTDNQPLYGEDVITAPPGLTLEAALAGFELDEKEARPLITALNSEFGTGPLSSGTKLRVAWQQKTGFGQDGEAVRIAKRISVYRGGQHIKSAALTDDKEVVWGIEPAFIPAVGRSDQEDEAVASVARSNLPNIYDGIYRAALSQGLNKDQARRIVRTVAFDVDFRTQSNPKDELEVFYSMEEGETVATDNSEILYIGLTTGGVHRKYYRFKAGDDGSVDYYDEEGKSAKKFLLRKPVPNGRFRSPFGMRRHPISRVLKMHNGVDFSAPRGTPIIAAGNGVVEKAGWAGGYGRQTIIRHANGYKTSYSHQHRIARGVRPGARVTQGQIIGQVGSTGYSTGPHLHYEVLVNGRKVNPMKIRLPQGRSLSGAELAAFRKERDRINALLDKGRGSETTVASLN